ncbi:MAG TPA: hypothetical protein VGR45_19200 [Stellaceae bacterium]|nr:hypothetical protein [Stellaceae bacterium]
MINKIQAAERQLDTAIRLLFENIDRLSAYTLAAASREITDGLCEKKKQELFRQEFARLGDATEVRLSFREEMKILIKEKHYQEAMILFRSRQNLLKHADRDAGAEMKNLSIDELSYVILFAIKNFTLLENRMTAAMSVFIHWFGAVKPRLLKLPKDTVMKLSSRG